MKGMNQHQTRNKGKPRVPAREQQHVSKHVIGKPHVGHQKKGGQRSHGISHDDKLFLDLWYWNDTVSSVAWLEVKRAREDQP